MTINENYFDDIELDDNDIKEYDGVVQDEQIIDKTPIEMYDFREKYCEHYSQEIIVMFNQKRGAHMSFLTEISKKLKQLFDIYNIKHSEIFVVYQNDLSHFSIHGFISFIDYHNYFTIITPVEQYSLRQSHMTFYITYPEMRYKDAIKFHMLLQDILWSKKNKNMFGEIGLQQNQVVTDSQFTVLPKHDYYRNYRVKISDIYSLENWSLFLPIIGNVFGAKARKEINDKLENRLNPFTDEWI